MIGQFTSKKSKLTVGNCSSKEFDVFVESNLPLFNPANIIHDEI